MPQNDTVRASGAELTFVEGSHNKYWQIIQAGNAVATRYGRIGSLGSITVHHEYNVNAAVYKMNRDLGAKERKGYRMTPASMVNFLVPTTVATLASSTAAHTGNGGINRYAGYALTAYYAEAALGGRFRIESDDPLIKEILSGAYPARRVALAALAGYRVTDKALAGLDDESLEIMAGFDSLNNGYSIASV